MMHLELMFVYNVKCGKGLCYVSGYLLILVLSVRKSIPSLLNFLCTFVKNQLTIFVDLFVDSDSVPLFYASILLPVPHCLINTALYIVSL